jgi:ABC-type phosphate transport system auxiliary subunit
VTFLFLQEQIGGDLSQSVEQHLSTKLSELRKEISILKSQIAMLLGVFDSQIISDFPEIFTKIKGKLFRNSVAEAVAMVLK